jgi:hypothetical protein
MSSAIWTYFMQRFFFTRYQRSATADIEGIDLALAGIRVVWHFQRDELKRVRKSVRATRPDVEKSKTIHDLETVVIRARKLAVDLNEQFHRDSSMLEEQQRRQEMIEGIRKRSVALSPGRVQRRVRDLAESAKRQRDLVSKAKKRDVLKEVLSSIEKYRIEMEKEVSQAEATRSRIPELERSLAAIKIEDVSLSVGTAEEYKELRATLERAVQDEQRGEYTEARRRIEEVDRRKDRLMLRLDERAHRSRAEIDSWLKLGSVATAFPQLRTFPPRLQSTDIAEWLALRENISSFVFRKASDARKANIPPTSHAGGRGPKLAPNHPLQLAFEEALDQTKREAFVEAAKAY